MTVNSPLVSVITIFLNAEDFLEEAIESVLGQTYQNWELLLVDDGSADASTEIAKRYAAQNLEQIHYLEHPDHENLGMGASRNLGIERAAGDYVAFLDADDVYLPGKILEQVKILEEHPQAAMLYGNTLYWYSWTADPGDREWDFIPDLGVDPGTLIEPPVLLSRYLRGQSAVPCTCSLLVRSDTLERVGGFEESFHGMYEDQAFYAKIVLSEPVLVSGECLERYRQHPESNVSLTVQSGQQQAARRKYLVWLQEYLMQQGIDDEEIWITLRKQLWLNSHYGRPDRSYRAGERDDAIRWLKKWLLRFEERLLPDSINYRLWKAMPE